MKRVVITGVGFYSPLGTTKDEVLTKLKLGENVVHIYEKFQEYKNTNTHLACEVTTDLPNFPRKKVRTAGRIGKLAIAATENAIKDSGLEIDFVTRYKTKATLVEVKATTGNTKSSKTILNNPEKYHVGGLIKLGQYNIGRVNNILTLPLYLAFLLTDY